MTISLVENLCKICTKERTIITSTQQEKGYSLYYTTLQTISHPDFGHALIYSQLSKQATEVMYASQKMIENYFKLQLDKCYDNQL